MKEKIHRLKNTGLIHFFLVKTQIRISKKNAFSNFFLLPSNKKNEPFLSVPFLEILSAN